jgi:hypothetical protein
LGIPDEFTCNRTDNKDLTSEWVKSKHDAGFKARYITSAAELRILDHSSLDYVMGESYVPFAVDCDFNLSSKIIIPSRKIALQLASFTSTLLKPLICVLCLYDSGFV